MRCCLVVFVLFALWVTHSTCSIAKLNNDDAAKLIVPPYQLGARVDSRSLWYVLDASGAHAGYAFETPPLAAFPGFSGAPIDLFVALDTNGDFIDVIVLEQNEPVFVSGLGEAPLNSFVRQYRGQPTGAGIEVGVPYGKSDRAISSRIYLDGVAKATASVRIVNETVLAAARKITAEFLQGAMPQPAAPPRLDILRILTPQEMFDEGLLSRRSVTNTAIEQMFAGSIWADDDPDARIDPDGLYLEIWVADLSIPSVAHSILSDVTRDELATGIRAGHRPILLLANGRHQLVDSDFIPHTAPDRIELRQGEFPAAARDAYIDIELKDEWPPFDQAFILQADTRLGFDPSREYELRVRSVRNHGVFRPERGLRDIIVPIVPNPGYFESPPPAPLPVWQAAIVERSLDLAGLTMLSAGLIFLLWQHAKLAAQAWYSAFRLIYLAVTIVFVGYWAQGQLSIVTPLGMIRTVIDGGSFLFLLYDPFSLLLWLIVLMSLPFWGRAFFCGWLCPFGAMQEWAAKLGRWLRLPAWRVPAIWDRRLKRVKYGVLAVLVCSATISASWLDGMVEIEPFKTAITLGFIRYWPFAIYAALCIALSILIFKGFCRYLCPLGAFLALGDRLRLRPWIMRREACGSPCQLCSVRCNYQAVKSDGTIDYAECFQCLDCVTIHDDPRQCVPLVLASKGKTLNTISR